MKSDFGFLKEYISKEGDHDANNKKYSLFSLEESDIVSAEKRMSLKFPKEIRDFYLDIGYGFFCNHDKQGFNRFMDPGSVADFRLGEDLYENDPDREMYSEEELAFFEVSEGSYLTVKLTTQGDKNPVYYFDKQISNSLEEFLKKMDKNTDYFLKE